MKFVAGYLCLGALALAGCNPSSPPPGVSPDSSESVGGSQTPAPGSNSESRIVAKVAGEPITLGQLMPPLIADHGLTTLLQIVELDLAKQKAALVNVKVTPADIETERQASLAPLFKQTDDKIQADIDDARAANDTKRLAALQDELKDQHAILMAEFLDNRHIAASEFDMAMETNAYLRKIAAADVDKAITPDVLKHAFNEEYGERMHVRFIQVSNPQQVAEIKRLLAKGEDFSELARTRSENPSNAGLGGDFRPFTKNDTVLPPDFIAMAASLKDGEVGDAIEYNGSFYIIKMEEHLPPLAVKFEDVKESVRATLYENIMQQEIKSLREQLAALALQEMQIIDPTMKQQYDDRKAQQEAQVRDQKRIKEEMDLEHHRLWDQIEASTRPATGPATQSESAPATKP